MNYSQTHTPACQLTGVQGAFAIRIRNQAAQPAVAQFSMHKALASAADIVAALVNGWAGRQLLLWECLAGAFTCHIAIITLHISCRAGTGCGSRLRPLVVTSLQADRVLLATCELPLGPCSQRETAPCRFMGNPIGAFIGSQTRNDHCRCTWPLIQCMTAPLVWHTAPLYC